ncbi:uncharacterized protein PgNI_03093 [Pyricularia grisea]|uniref:Uncharacterized protein n=1 Tax=Pyricularia grisea TaxID=148305 RepID=A0A6P8B7Z9_PYRGI|nr:uncharacterized protein PgNI_03093 [Pyricularia grisea]TLD11994.1 hypothetical protein PgNI_03093 [Pyricularia grisea]
MSSRIFDPKCEFRGTEDYHRHDEIVPHIEKEKCMDNADNYAYFAYHAAAGSDLSSVYQLVSHSPERESTGSHSGSNSPVYEYTGSHSGSNSPVREYTGSHSGSYSPVRQYNEDYARSNTGPPNYGSGYWFPDK